MAATTVLLAALTPPVPRVLTEAEPAARLRWREVGLETAGPSTGKRIFQFEASAPVVLRFEGVPSACRLTVKRRFVAGGARADVEIPVARDGTRLVVVVPSALERAESPPRDARVPETRFPEPPAPAVLFVADVPSACGDVRPRVYQAALDEDDKEGPLRVVDAIRALAITGVTDEAAIAWSRAPHPHRWQAMVTDAAVLRRLLAQVPGTDAELGALVEALVERAVREAPWPDIEYLWHAPLALGGTARDVATESGAFEELEGGRGYEADVGAAQALRLRVRLPLTLDEPGPVATRVRLMFDGRAPTVVAVLGGRDVASMTVTRARTLVVPVPNGARRARITSLDRNVLVRGERVWRKRHLEDTLRTSRHLPARGPTTPDPRAALTRALCEAVAGDARAWAVAARLARADGPLAGWVDLERVRAEGNVQALRAALRNSASSPAPRAGLDAAGALVVRRLADELRAELALADNRGAAAVRTFIRAAAERALTDEEASWLADAQAFVGDDVSFGGHVLAVIDGLRARRPLDRALAAAHARTYGLGSRWRRLAPRTPVREVTFLDALEGAPAAAGRARFAPIAAAGLDVDVPLARAAGHSPALTLVTRPTATPEARAVTLDGRPLARLPVTSTLDRFDVAVPPGRHHLEVSPFAVDGTLANFGAAPAAGFVLREYAELEGAPLSFQLAELGVPATILVSLRAIVTSAAAPGASFELTLETSAGERWVAPVTLDPGEHQDLPLALVVPLGSRAASLTLSAQRVAGVRLFVQAAARTRRALDGPPRAAPPGPETPALGRARALVDADEPLLAREALLALLDDPGAAQADLDEGAALWRALDEDTAPTAPGGLSSSPALCLLPQGVEAPTGDAGDLLATLADARAAEGSGALARAAELWYTLASARPRCAALRRQAARTLLAADPGADAATRAYVTLATAAALDPSDELTARALRSARRRTRLRFIPFAERSAGSFLVQTPRGDAPDADEPTATSWSRDDGRAGVVGRDRELGLSFSMARPARVVLRVAPVELRPRAAEALSPDALALTWSRDGATTEVLPCATGRQCATPAFVLGPGAHVVTARLSGGVRPVARLWLDDTGAPPSSLRRASWPPAPSRANPPTALATTFVSEHLAATPGTPIHLTVAGPVVLRVELRGRASAAANVGASARVSARPSGEDGDAERLVREILLPGARDPDATGPDVGALCLPTVVELPLALARPYAVEIDARSHLVVARVGVWEGLREPSLAPPAPFAFVSRDPAPAASPLTLADAPAVAIVDGDVFPGHEDVGTLGLWTAASRVSTDPEGAPVQTVNALHFGTTYRQLVEPVHTAIKVEAAERLNEGGAPSQALSTSLFFIHPEHRAIRFGADGDLRTQPVGGDRAWSGRLSLLVEPVVTLTPGLHLVSKIASWWSRRTLADVPSSLLPGVDPEVFSRYDQSHPRALAWEEGLETEPFVNVVLYANARATTNPSLRPNDLDHLSASLFARTLLGRFYVEALGRTTWFLPDDGRARAARHSWLGTRFFHTLWPSERQMVELGAVAGYDFGTHSPEVSVSLVWEGSNARRFKDHSAREGEDFFFAERGPGFGTTHLTVAP